MVENGGNNLEMFENGKKRLKTFRISGVLMGHLQEI